MTTRKRLADTTLSPCSVVILQPVQKLESASNMGLTRPQSGICSRLSNWLGSWFSAPEVYTDLEIGTTDVVAENYIQSSTSRSDDAHTIKRQKTRALLPIRPKSAEAVVPMPRVRSRDIFSGQSEVDGRKNLDEYWRPKEHSLLRMKSSAHQQYTQTPPRLLDETPAVDPDRQRSEFTKSPPRDQEPFSQHTQRIRVVKLPSAAQPIGHPYQSSTHDLSIDETLNNLFLDAGDDGGKVLALSTTKDKQRVEEFERRQKEEEEERRKVEEERKIAEIEAQKALRLTRRHPNKRLIQPLGTKWEEKISGVQSNTNPTCEMTKSIGGTGLLGKDFATLLGPRAWLNDEIINAYIEWIVDAANKTAAAQEGEATVPRFIAHNSFFYENLTKKGPASTDRLMKRKKAPGSSLLEVDTIFVPICRSNHWTVGVVRPLARTIEYFDSFGGQSKDFFARIRSWLQHQLGKDYTAEAWTEPRTGCAQQTNGYDCGVFVCTNAFCVGFGLETSSYRERDMLQQRRNIAAVLLNRGFHGDFVWEKMGL